MLTCRDILKEDNEISKYNLNKIEEYKNLKIKLYNDWNSVFSQMENVLNPPKETIDLEDKLYKEYLSIPYPEILSLNNSSCCLLNRNLTYDKEAQKCIIPVPEVPIEEPEEETDILTKIQSTIANTREDIVNTYTAVPTYKTNENIILFSVLAVVFLIIDILLGFRISNV